MNKNESLGAFWHGKKKRAEKKKKRKEKRAARKKRRKEKRAERRAKRGGKTWAGALIQKVNRYNPATIVLRNGFLLAMKKNLFKISQKLRFGYLSDEQAKAAGLNPKKIAKVRKTLTKAIKVFEGAGGKKENLKKAIINGKWNKNPVINGFNDDNNLAYATLGEVATGTIIAAASSAIVALLQALKSDGVDKIDEEAENAYVSQNEGDGEGASEEGSEEEGDDGLGGILLPVMIVAGAAGAYLVFSAGKFGVNAVKIQNNLIIETGIAQLTAKKLVIDVTMKNPAGGKITITHPFVKIFTSEEKLKLNEPDLSSSIENKEYTIEPFAETKMQITIPITLMGGGLAIINIAKQPKEDRKVWIVTQTTINNAVPYEKKDIVPIPKLDGILNFITGEGE